MHILLHLTSRIATMSGMKLSREGAIGNLKVFFGSTGAEYVSVEDIYKNAARSEYSLDSNRKWLYNRLTLIKPYGLYEKVNGVQNGVRVTRGLALTPEGKKALNDAHDSMSLPRSQGNRLMHRQVSVTSVREDVEVLREMYPEFEFVFDVRFKDEIDA